MKKIFYLLIIISIVLNCISFFMIYKLENKYTNLQQHEQISDVKKDTALSGTKWKLYVENSYVFSVTMNAADREKFLSNIPKVEITYEFMPNGELCANGNIAGLYDNEKVLLKSKNGKINISSYYLVDDELYVNFLYYDGNFVVSTDVYKCDKIK